MKRESNIFWCKECNTPLLSPRCDICGIEGKRVAADIRPVFPEERKLLEIFLGLPDGELCDKCVWDTNSNNLLVDGETFVMSKSDIMQKDPEEIRSLLYDRTVTAKDQDYFNEQVCKFIAANVYRLQRVELEADEIIKKAKKGRQDYIPIVSFSGGKDSTVVSDLVRRMNADERIIHIFGDTTLELPVTYDYIEQFRLLHSKTPVIRSKSNHDFLTLCDQIGPPSRVMRWCCTVFKTGPIGQTFSGFAQNRRILTYYGIRRSESNSRSDYDAISESPKVDAQTVVSPIINWFDSDVWLYIFAHKLAFNDAYRMGFSRVGCWSCPSNSSWSFYLTRIYYPELAEPWRDYLIDLASSMGKLDPIEYVDSGNWKARQGGQGLRNAYKGIISSRPCGDDPDAKTYTLTRPINDELYEYFKPFGMIDKSRGRSILGEVFIVDKSTKDPILLLQGLKGNDELRVKVISDSNPTLLLQRVDCQLRKYQSCVLCGGCPPICPAGAITVNTGRYSIDEDRCTNCLSCVSHYDTGCLVSKVLKTKKGQGQ